MILLPPNTRDSLHPMDLSVNKPVKDFLKRHFEEWYSGEVIKQLDDKENEAVNLEPVNLGLPMLKELGATFCCLWRTLAPFILVMKLVLAITTK